MERKLTTLDISGLDVDLILTDDDKLLGGEDRAGDDDRTSELSAFGKYNVDQCKIWLDASLSCSIMRSHLFHEMHEFVLAYYNMFLAPEDNHEAFARFSSVLWEVMLRNREILFGRKIAELLRVVRIDERQQMAKDAEQEG